MIKIHIHFKNLDIGGLFPCYKMPLRFQRLYIQGHTLLPKNAHVGFNKACIHVVLQHATAIWPNMINPFFFTKKLRFTSLNYKILDIDSMTLSA